MVKRDREAPGIQSPLGSAGLERLEEVRGRNERREEDPFKVAYQLASPKGGGKGGEQW